MDSFCQINFCQVYNYTSFCVGIGRHMATLYFGVGMAIECIILAHHISNAHRIQSEHFRLMNLTYLYNLFLVFMNMQGILCR